MRLTSDIILYHKNWERADNELCNEASVGLFSRLVDLFLAACAIGIMDDKSVEVSEELTLDNPKNIGRNTYQSLANTDLYDTLDFMLQNAILNSKTIDLDPEKRLKLAFDPEYDNKKISPMNFLVGFANYGLEKIYEKIDSKASIVVIDELYEYFNSLTLSKYDDLLSNFTLEELDGNL